MEDLRKEKGHSNENYFRDDTGIVLSMFVTATDHAIAIKSVGRLLQFIF